jgi:hypothetical protein
MESMVSRRKKKRGYTMSAEQRAASGARLAAYRAKAKEEKARRELEAEAGNPPTEIADQTPCEHQLEVINGDVPEVPMIPSIERPADINDPTRRARLAMAQARILATPEGRLAVARHNAEKEEAQANVATIAPPSEITPVGSPSLPPSRIGSREVSLVVRNDGTMVSLYGPCVCGRAKREWHGICLKQ